MTPKVRPLESGYSAQTTRCDETSWGKIVGGFDDASLYQTWTYDAVRRNARNLGHCVVSQSGRIVAAAQARLLQVPGLPLGAAYVRWAPLWRRPDKAPDQTDFRMCLRALRNEFVLRRGLFLRVYPLAYDVDGIDYGAILNEEGYTAALEEVPQRTFLLDLGLPLADIRMNFDHKWRNCLSKAERNELEYVQGTGDALFADFMHLYRALLDRKKFKEPSDIAEFRAIQQQLPDDQKMMLFLTGKNGTVSCGAICTALGRTGVYLFGACNDQGLTTNGSYLIQWKIVQWLKQQGCFHYNLNGINPEKNPGTYHFKAGVAGKARREVRYLGRFDAYAGSPTATGVHVMNAALLRCKSMLRQARGQA